MYKKLTQQEKLNLKSQHRKERNPKVRDRIKAVLAFDDGYNYTEIARILLLDDETIRRHIQDYFEKNNKLKLNSGGSHSYLNSLETAKLISHLESNTYLYVKDICAYVKDKFSKSYTVSGMTKWLKNNGFCYKKTHPVPAKADEVQQQKFINYYNKLKSKFPNEPIYFADSSHPSHKTRTAYGWILKGKRQSVAINCSHRNVNIIGGINLSGHKFHYEIVDKVNADTMALFFSTLRKKHPEKTYLHIILDNAGYHKNKELKKFAKGLAIKLHFLPPYSPNLNPVERVWKIFHQQTTYNKYYEKFHGFKSAVYGFFKNIWRQKKLLQNRITDNFNLIQSPELAY